MPSYTLTAVRTTNFTGADGTNIETLVNWLDPFPETDNGGYYAVISNKCKLEFSNNDLLGLADLTGSYANNQYVVARLGDLDLLGSPSSRIEAFLHCTGGSATGTSANHYRMVISQYTVEPTTTRIFRVNSGASTQIAIDTSLTWANGDRFLFVDYGGTIEVYRDSGSGFGSTAVLSVDDTASRLTGGVPGFMLRRPDAHTLDDLEMGDATLVTTSDLTGSITLDAVDPTGTLGLNPSTLTGSITLDAVAPTGTLGIAPGSVTTLPFSRNTGSRPAGLTAVAVAILSDDANMTRLAGATSINQDGAGRITYTGAGLPSVGTSVLVVTREPDGKLGIERYTVA